MIIKPVLVYLSGPITPAHGFSVKDNIEAASVVFLQCVRAGIPAFCPHFSALVDASWAIPHADWMQIDLAVLDRCTHLLLLPRWETSPGAQIEVAFARQKGLPVISDLAEVA